jgi:hypothetical protein
MLIYVDLIVTHLVDFSVIKDVSVAEVYECVGRSGRDWGVTDRGLFRRYFHSMTACFPTDIGNRFLWNT